MPADRARATPDSTKIAEAFTATATAIAEPAPKPRRAEFTRELGRGNASWYGLRFHGRRTANGERYDMYSMTAAHRTLPFGTIVRVHSLVNGSEVDVRINDRGPYARGRLIDVSYAAALKLGMLELGIKNVLLMVVEPALPGMDIVPPGSTTPPGFAECAGLDNAIACTTTGPQP